MVMSDTTYGPQPMFNDEALYQELVDRHGRILGPPVHSQPTKQGTDPKSGNTIQVPNPDSPLRYSFEDGSLIDVSPNGGIQIVRTGKGVDGKSSSPKVTRNATGQLVQVMDGQGTVIDPTTRPEKPHITKTGDGRTIAVYADGRAVVVDDKPKPAAAAKPTIRTNALGQLVSIAPDGTETVLDKTEKPNRPGSVSGRSSDHPPIKQGNVTWIWNPQANSGQGGYELPAGIQSLNPRGWPTSIKDPYGNDLFLTGTNNDGTPSYQAAPGVPSKDVHTVTGTDRNSPTTVAYDANGQVLWTTPNAGYVNPLANTLGDESNVIAGIKQRLADGSIEPDEATQLLNNVRTSMRATTLGVTPEQYLARQQTQADFGRGTLEAMAGQGNTMADRLMQSATSGKVRGLGGISFTPYQNAQQMLGGNQAIQQAQALMAQVKPVTDRMSALDALSKYAGARALYQAAAQQPQQQNQPQSSPGNVDLSKTGFSGFGTPGGYQGAPNPNVFGSGAGDVTQPPALTPFAQSDIAEGTRR